MTEYARTINSNNGAVHQWVDAERCMVLDLVTGEPQRFGAGHNIIGTFEEAIAYANEKHGWEGRTVVIKMSCVVAFEVSPNA